jgi:hypothetical protein
MRVALYEGDGVRPSVTVMGRVGEEVMGRRGDGEKRRRGTG